MPFTRWLGVILFFAGASASVAADIYVWRDTAGVSHYTTDIENVPPEYRNDAIKVVKEWARAEPAPEAVAAPVPATAAVVDPSAAPARDGYDAAYRAGFRAGERGEAPASSSSNVGSVTQNVEVQPQSGVVADRLVPVPVLVERHRDRAPRREETYPEDARDRDRLPPAQRAPFIQGPAGPPPINER